MYCKKCGAELKEGAKFCIKCGYQVSKTVSDKSEDSVSVNSEDQEVKKQVNPAAPKTEKKPVDKKPKKKSGGKTAAIIICIVLGILVLGYGGVTGYFNLQIKSESKKIDEAGIENLIDYKNEIYSGKIDFNPISAKETLEDIKVYSGYIDRYYDIDEELEEIYEEEEDYSFGGDAYKKYEEIIDSAVELLYNEEIVEGIRELDRAKEYRVNVLDDCDKAIEDRISMYEELNLEDAEKDTKEKYDELMSEIYSIDLEEHKSIDSDDEDKYITARAAYREVNEVFDEMDKELFLYLDSENELEMNITALSLREFPYIKLYIGVKVKDDNSFPDNLYKKYFSVERKDDSGKYVEEEIISAGHLKGQDTEDEKMYMIEFKDSTGMKEKDDMDIKVVYKDIEYSGLHEHTYTYSEIINYGSGQAENKGISDSKHEVSEGEPAEIVGKYLKGFASAMTYQDFSYISSYIKTGSNLYKTQKAYVANGVKEELDSYEILSTDYSGSNSCTVSTKEIYKVYSSDGSIKTVRQKCKYSMEFTGDGWKLTDFAAPITTF